MLVPKMIFGTNNAFLDPQIAFSVPKMHFGPPKCIFRPPNPFSDPKNAFSTPFSADVHLSFFPCHKKKLYTISCIGCKILFVGFLSGFQFFRFLELFGLRDPPGRILRKISIPIPPFSCRLLPPPAATVVRKIFAQLFGRFQGAVLARFCAGLPAGDC